MDGQRFHHRHFPGRPESGVPTPNPESQTTDGPKKTNVGKGADR